MKSFTVLLAVASVIFSAGFVLPSPNMRLFPITVGAPELAPWLVILNALAAAVAFAFFRPLAPVFLGGVLVAVWPLMSIPGVILSMTQQQLRVQIHPMDLLLGSSNVPQIEPQTLPKGTLLYKPASQRAPLPVLIDLYSGAWRAGEPKDDETFSRYMAGRGYAVFAIDYRHAPAARYPAQIDDVRAAISWISRRVRFVYSSRGSETFSRSDSEVHSAPP